MVLRWFLGVTAFLAMAAAGFALAWTAAEPLGISLPVLAGGSLLIFVVLVGRVP